MSKQKRRITNIDFSHEGAHVALVSKSINGGPANQYEVLLTKGTQDIDNDILKKAAEVQVELSFVDFLRKFFDMYYTDAQTLARFLGYEISDDEANVETYEEYIDSKIENMTLLKSANKSADLDTFLKELSADEVVNLLEVQSQFEKSTSGVTDDVQNENQLEENSQMTIEEFIKSAEGQTFLAAELNKAKDEGRAEVQTVLDEVQADLEKAVGQVAELEEAQAEAKTTARTERLVKAVGEEEAETLIKSLGSMDDEAFDTIVKSFESKAAAIAESDLAKEVGVGGEGDADEDDGTAQYLRNKYQNK